MVTAAALAVYADRRRDSGMCHQGAVALVPKGVGLG